MEMKMDDVELEVKYFVVDLHAIEQRLVELGATLHRSREHEINLRFDTPDQALYTRKQVLRLRRDNESRLTFKGPGADQSGVLARQEIEVFVSDFEAMRRILEMLGYQVQMIYEKYRTVYIFNSTEISLDELPYGKFIEIEGENSAAIRDFSMKLNLDWDACIGLNYVELFQCLKQKLKLDFQDLVFENFRGIKITASDLEVKAAD